MGYVLTKKFLEAYEEERVMAVITSHTRNGKKPTIQEIADELFADPDIIQEVITGLINQGKIQEVS